MSVLALHLMSQLFLCNTNTMQILKLNGEFAITPAKALLKAPRIISSTLYHSCCYLRLNKLTIKSASSLHCSEASVPLSSAQP